MDAIRWQRLSPQLDRLLELTTAARAASLDALRRDDPVLASELDALLALEDAHHDFLHDPLHGPPGAGRTDGSHVGPYRLERLLGEGGMGEVWLAERSDGLYRRRLALKLLRPGHADPQLRERFTREWEILGRLQHPNIAALLDAGISQDDQPYLALEYVDGIALGDYCALHALTVAARLQLFLQVCAAVSHAHTNLIVHRDLKPSNMLVSADGRVHLLDFGIATLLDGGEHEPVRSEVRAFTLHYAAPEQIRGEPLSTLTDVYALGVVLYELLAGDKPYRLRRQCDAEWERTILETSPAPPSATVRRLAQGGRIAAAPARRLEAALRGDLDAILARALEKEPARRYPSVEAFAADLQRHLDGRPVQVRAQTAGYRLGRYLRRHRWSSVAGAAFVSLLMATLVVALWQARDARREAARAQAMQRLVVGVFDHAASDRPERGRALRAALAHAAERGEHELRNQPRARAELLGLVAHLASGLGDESQALQLAAREQALLEAHARRDDVAVLAAATRHARLLRRAGRASDCIARLTPLLDRMQAVQARSPRQAADLQMELGHCRFRTGAPHAARRWFGQALALRRDRLHDTPGEVEAMVALAMLDAAGGASDAALRRLVDARRQLVAGGGGGNPLRLELDLRIGSLYQERARALTARHRQQSAAAGTGTLQASAAATTP